MKETIKLYIIYILRLCLRIFFLLPIKRNRLLFIAFNGTGYCCNPKYITENLLENHPSDFDIYWAFNSPESFETLKNKHITPVRFKSIKFFCVLASSKIIITNTGLPSYLVFKKNQTLINTWHGGGAYKKSGFDLSMHKTEIKKTMLTTKSTNIFISACRRFSVVISHSIGLPLSKMLEIGMPRNDILFKDNAIIFDNVRLHFGLSPKTKILLYAPTFRGETKSASGSESFDFEKCLHAVEKRFSGDWVVFYRAHYFVSSKINETCIIDASSYPDMQELLIASDILITDYSSCMWDMSLTNKPCFIFATDIEQYKSERDFYTPLNELPFPITKSSDELANAIMEFDENKYKLDVKRHHDSLGSFEKGDASKKISEIIYKICYNISDK